MVKGISNALLVSKLKFSKNESFFKKYFLEHYFIFLCLVVDLKIN